MKLSIIIPVHNQEKLIKRAIESIPKECEIIVIDDASTDKTVEVIKSFKQVKLIRNKNNLGVGLTRNKGIEIATGDYIGFLDSDDYFYTDKLLKTMELMGEYDVIFYNMITNEHHEINVNKNNHIKRCGMNKIIKREFLGDIRFPDLRAREDYFFTSELLSQRGHNIYTNEIVYHYNYPRESSLNWKDQRGLI